VTLTQAEAFGLTLLIEGPLAAALGIASGRAAFRCGAAAVAASTITHPLLWLAYPSAYGYFAALTTPLLEASVIAAETPFYRTIASPRWEEAALLSVLVNAASWAAGEFIYAMT